MVLFSIALVSTLIVSAMVLIFPSHEGEMRTDLEVGDYYTIRISRTIYETSTITAIDGDVLTVDVVRGDQTATRTMTKDAFLMGVYLTEPSTYEKTDVRAVIETQYGQHLCTMYTRDLGNYWVDEKNVIYRSYQGGVDKELTETSLFK